MGRLQTAFVLGYHGCRQQVADKILKDNQFIPSDHDYDWLGPGVYFWEANPNRAWEFAEEAAARNQWEGPLAVVGAVIDLGNCLDLASADGSIYIERAYYSLSRSFEYEKDLPKNNKEKGLHKLDCAVIRRLHQIVEEERYEPFDSVRGIFQEGQEIYPGSAFRKKTHIQIAVRNPSSVKGIFRVP